MSLITSIQKYSIHDGDGIRTTVFFKGCPLRCVWCHNPETQSFQKELSYDMERCVGCGSCEAACPSHAVYMKDGKAMLDKAKCTACGACVDYCNLNLREVVGEEKEIADLVRELEKDQMFYEESGGGVTLSGGEVMACDMDYVEELAKRLHRRGISVFIDTCGHVPYKNFERLLPYVDTFLYDVKTTDPEVHKEYMGVDNTLILENLEKLSKDGARIYIRIPVILEVNGKEEDILDIIRFLEEKKIHAAQVNLLPYHNTGSGKYAKVGMEYGGTDLHAPSKDEMEHLRELFRNHGFHNVKIGG